VAPDLRHRRRRTIRRRSPKQPQANPRWRPPLPRRSRRPSLAARWPRPRPPNRRRRRKTGPSRSPPRPRRRLLPRRRAQRSPARTGSIHSLNNLRAKVVVMGSSLLRTALVVIGSTVVVGRAALAMPPPPRVMALRQAKPDEDAATREAKEHYQKGMQYFQAG